MINNSKGISLYLTLMTMSILIALALGISVILFNQLKMTRMVGYSVMAFYASNTGVERTLYEISRGATIEHCEGKEDCYKETLENGSEYIATILGPGETCSAANYCIKSIGTYKDTRRAIRLSR